MKQLLLWDIDGTLMWGAGAGEQALVCAMKDTFDIDASLDGIDYSGRTDRHIAHMLIEAYELPLTEENERNFVEAYLNALQDELERRNAHACAGIAEIVEQAHAREQTMQGLLTGNMQRGARLKLSRVGLWEYFPFGAFADDSAVRNELGPHALRRAQEHSASPVAPQAIFVIGDTPHDIGCGKIIGAHTIAVATGKHSLKQLAKHEPSLLFDDFSDTKAFFQAIDAVDIKPKTF